MKTKIRQIINYVKRDKNARKAFAIASQHKLTVMVSAAIILSLSLTIFNVALYQASPVSDLDLSRPGYEPVRDRIEPNVPQKTFASDGPINEAALTEFESLYKIQADNLNNSGNYADSGLDDDHLGIGAPQ